MMAILRRKDGEEIYVERDYFGFSVTEPDGDEDVYYVRDEPQYVYDAHGMLVAVRYREAVRESREV